MSDNVVQKPYQWLAWLATATLVLGSILASFNFYPWYSVVFAVANTMWIVVGLLWRERSLVVMNSAITLIYIVGLLFK